MSKSEMIKWLQNLKKDIGQSQHQDLWHYAEMLDEVTGAIEASEDCISRDWVLNRLTKYQKDYALNELDDWQNTVVEWITTDIENAPSVVPSRAEGEWIRTFDGNEWYWYCSNCKEQWYEDDLYMGGNEFPHFCPNCGEKMKGAE